MAPIHPGDVLREDFLIPLNLSASALARHIGVPPNRIGAIASGGRGVAGGAAPCLAIPPIAA